MRRIHKGQTLLELLACLAILAIVTTLAADSWEHARENARSREAINRLVLATREARHLALTHRRTVTVCPSTKPNSCDGLWTDSLLIFAGRATSGDKKILATLPPLSRGHVQWKSFRGENFLEMQGSGLTLAQNGTFVYCPDNGDLRYARALVLNKSGRARVAVDLNGDGIIDLNKTTSVSCAR